MNRAAPTRRPYAPPSNPDAPLDEIELALVKALVRVLVDEIRNDRTCWITSHDGRQRHRRGTDRTQD